MSEGRRINDGDPIGDYFPKIVDLATFTAVQNRRPGTPGQIGKAVTNLFTGICFDGASGARMKYVDKGTKKRGNGNWRYLVSDARRKDPAAPLCSWRYSDFENSFLKFVEDLDWAAIAGAGSSKPSRLGNAVAKVRNGWRGAKR